MTVILLSGIHQPRCEEPGHRNILLRPSGNGLQDKNWRELLKYCAAREAYRGYGAAEMDGWMRTDGASDDMWGAAADDDTGSQISGEHVSHASLSCQAWLGRDSDSLIFCSL